MEESDKTTSDSGSSDSSDSSSSASSDDFKIEVYTNPKITNSGDREATKKKVPENSHQKFQDKIKSFQDNKKRKLDTNNNSEQNQNQNDNNQNLTKLLAENKTLRETVFSLSKILANSGNQVQNSDSSSNLGEVSEMKRLKESVMTKDSKINILSGLVASLRKENSEIVKESVYEKSRSQTLEKTVNTQKQIIDILKKGGSDLEKHVDFCEKRMNLK